ncbi:GLPGLI family protein [Marinifilum breve]|uniref:GLPGLI family protein n=1 Tax=Marinifilum breve TaxID=2184082 RepID=A0A2V4A3D7_9BACT|nr:GLPGLI family protein [Marinifilum breve]PXY03018.1 GLPGLI family protein [Marinifilum breve]
MKKYVFAFACFLVFGNCLFAQDFQGKAYYESKTTINMDFWGRQIPEDRKKMILERMKQMSERTYILSFNRTESVYKQEEKLEQPGMGQGRGGMRMGMMMGAGGEDYYKNVKAGKYAVSKDLFGKIFLVNDSLPKLQWQMQAETKKIGNYTAYKATAVKHVSEPNMRAVFQRRGRGVQTDSKEPEMIEKEVEIVAWYCPEIPVNQGPGEYWGLPGLIMELNDGRTSILCSKIVINPKEKIDIKEPNKGKEVSQAEYDEISRKKMKEMRENFRSMRPGGRRR